MSEQLRESLSAVMDDEADAFELRRVLDEAKQDGELREQWHRLHQLRDFMRNEGQAHQPGLRAAIWEELNRPLEEDEKTVDLALAELEPGSRGKRSPWFGRLTGTAVAAAVALAVVFNGGVFTDPSVESVSYGGVAATNPSNGLVPVMYQQAKLVDQNRQNGLMLLHYQQRAMNQAGVTSFVKMATFRRQQIGIEALGTVVPPIVEKTIKP